MPGIDTIGGMLMQAQTGCSALTFTQASYANVNAAIPSSIQPGALSCWCRGFLEPPSCRQAMRGYQPQSLDTENEGMLLYPRSRRWRNSVGGITFACIECFVWRHCFFRASHAGWWTHWEACLGSWHGSWRAKPEDRPPQTCGRSLVPRDR